ncbi:uncharacterized protein LOC112538547 [Tetranychus urticae]|uniref:Uncharacterized protein n=1 Tax=Tetranychus urticae TaxID=32264 RepID=A0A158P4I9_TETUR|nr:uncharacterized protein LOC112538547 [Tetranychus urticae]
MSSSGSKDLIDSCELHIPIRAGYVILKDPISEKKLLRPARYYGNYVRKIEELIDERKTVDDAESMDGDRYVIIFYGSHDSASKFLESEKMKDLRRKQLAPSSQTLSLPSTSRKESELESTTRKLRSQSRNVSESAHKVAPSSVPQVKLLKDLEIKFESMKDDLKEIKVLLNDFISSQDLPDLSTGPTKEASMAKQACKAIRSFRKQGFEKKLALVDWDKIISDPIKVREIKDILMTQEWPSKMVSDIAEILYGDTLLDHILGRHGKRDRKARRGERQLTVSRSEEEKLRCILSVFGTTFTTDTAWQILVQHYVNQRGRDMKNRLTKEKDEERVDPNIDDDSSDSPEAKRSRLVNHTDDDADNVEE